MSLLDLDMDFISRVEKVIAFNLTASDFQSLTHKKEIQFVFTKNLFPNFNLKAYAVNTIDMVKLNNAIAKLKSYDRDGYNKLHKYTVKGIGPGEIMLYYLTNTGYLGGGQSAGVDLIVGSKQYEIKAVDITGDGKYAFNFKTGGTFNTSDLIARGLTFKKKVNGGGEGINTATINEIKKQFPDEWDKLEKDYKKRVYDNYFRNHEMIFINNKTTKIGEIVAIKKVAMDDIIFERVTSGVIKPRVKI